MRIVPTLLLAICFASAAWYPMGSNLERAPEFTVVDSEGASTVIDVTIHGVELTEKVVDGKTYQVVSLPGANPYYNAVGKPQVPTVPGVIAIPDHSTPSVEVIGSDYIEIKDVELYPFQPLTTDLGEVYPFTIDKAAYNTDAYFPQERAETQYTGYFRDLYITTVKVAPVSYNPVTRTLRVYKNLRVRINHGGSFRPRMVEPEFARIYRDFIKNYAQLSVVEGRPFDQGVRLLVFCPTGYESTIQPLVDWHHKQGVETRTIVKSSFTYNEVKDSIQNEYNNHSPAKLKWVLLIGDVSDVPTYTYWGVPASDIWYVDFDLNYYADCSIGRLSCDNSSDLTNQITKTLKFAQDPEMGTWLEKSVLVAHKENYPGKYSLCKREIYNYPYGYYTFTMDTLMGALSGITNSDVTNAINQGRVVVNYRGHGDTYIWWHWNLLNQDWATTDVNALNNGDKTSVVLNICCSSGNINANDCLSEVWLEKYPGGAVASWAASDPSYTTANHALDKAFYWALGDNTSHGTPYTPPVWDVGWIGNYADFYMVAYGGGGGSTNYKMYLWNGDPAIEVWRGQPADPVVDHPTNIPTGSQNFTVTVADSKAPIEDALVCVSKGAEVYEWDYTNSSGQVTFAINPTTAGVMDVTVTPHNFIPYEGICNVGTGVAEGEQGITTGIWLESNLVKKGLSISYALSDEDQLTVKIFDAIGREVIRNSYKVAGKGIITVPTRNLAAGVYFVNVNSSDRTLSEQFVILR